MSSLWLRCFVFVFVRSFVRDGTFAELFALVLAAREQTRAAVLRACALRCEKLTFAWKRRGVKPRTRTCRVQSAFAFALRSWKRNRGGAEMRWCGVAVRVCLRRLRAHTQRLARPLFCARPFFDRPSVRASVRSGLHRFGVTGFWEIARTFPGPRAIPPRFAVVRPSRLLVLPWPDSEKAGFGSVGF